MPKYVAKEDVEKGLVDPTKSLDQQPEYKQKIEQQAQEKEKLHQKKAAQYRPKKERPPRKERPKFNWNKQEITLETIPPEKPKKLLEKPDAQKHKQGLEKLKAERQAIKLEKSTILDEQRALIRDIIASKNTGRTVLTQYSGAMKEKIAAQNQLRKEIRALDDEKKNIMSEIDILKAKSEELRRPGNSLGLSLETIKQRIVEKEHQLTTANIGKKEETKLYNQINELKRALSTAKPMIEIEAEVNKLEDQITILYKNLKPIKHELHIKITEANGIRAELEVLKEQKKNQQGTIQEQRTVEDIKAEYDIKIKAIEAKRDKLEEKIDDYVDKHIREVDDYEDQQDLLNYIAWVEDQKVYLKKKKEEEERKKKQWQEREKKRQKEKQQYEKRKEQRKRQEEERKARDEERKKRLEQQRERYINRNPHHQTIDLCQTLIDYCSSLRPTAFVKFEDPRTKNPGELNFGKQWQKEIKSGAQVVASKKSKQDQEIKKPMKQKKKEEKPENQDFEHGIEVVNQFQAINLLPPKNSSEIDSTIKLIQDKIAFYNNPTEEEKAAYRHKAAREFDERHAPRDNRGKQGAYKQKEEQAEEEERPKQKKYNQRKEKKEFKETDFPEL